MTSPAAPAAPDNPLLADWTTPYEAPPFGRIKPEHFRPAFDRAFAEHEAEIAAIAADPAPPTFDNTIAALELRGRALAARRRRVPSPRRRPHQRRAARDRARDLAALGARTGTRSY